ncbi:eukaryotic translation initiation factor 4B [[Candida] anglica]|uniref:Eukaryotic translation initiation factor 4B n=1 Tax=[Candida] anglica TaxID=148631 RepID=A0ABP0EKI0_9ASCO
MAPKKSVKMDLGSFLADDSLGGSSWADEEVDMASIGVPMSTAAPVSSRRLAENNSFNREESYGSGMNEQRRERQEYPIPDHPPFRARVGNLAWEADEQSLVDFFETKLQSSGIVSDVKLPVDNLTGRLRGFGFLTFNSRESLEEGLRLSFADFNGRKIYVDVAAPEKADVFDMDWRAARGSGQLRGGDRGDRGDRADRPPRREEPNLDWGSARGSGVLPPREPRGDRGDRADRPPRREEPSLDWGSARGSGVLPPREPRGDRGDRADRPPRREEPSLDWGSARGSGVLPPREPRERTDRPLRPKKNEPELDWGSAKGSGSLPPREPREHREPRKQSTGPALDWKRGQALEPRTKATKKVEEDNKKEIKPQKSVFDVLAVEGESDEEEEEEEVEEPKPKAEEELVKATADLTIDSESKESGDWEVVGK